MPLLEIADLAASYGKAVVLQGISLDLEARELVAVIGPNGAGKTTLMRTISGFTRRSGRINFRGKAIERLLPHEVVKEGIVLCPERRRLFPEMTVLRNLEMGAYLRQDKEGVRQDLAKVFTLFPRLRERLKNKAATLSGGEQQMLAIARSLMSKPKLLMLDEPSFGLAPLVKGLIVDVLHEIRGEGIAILLTEQDARLAIDVALRLCVLENGRFALQGDRETLMADSHVKEAYLGVA